MKVSDEEIDPQDFSAYCEKCLEYTTHKVLEQRPVDIPPGEYYSISKCKVCGEEVEDLSLHLTLKPE